MSSRHDSLDKDYRPIEVFDTISTVLYWLLFALSLILLYVKDANINNLLTAAFILLTVTFFLANNFLKVYLIPRVENKRRVHLLSNSFGVCLDHERTTNYYNNNITPSFLKLGANVFENSLFSKIVVSRMLVAERVKIGAYALLFIASILYQRTDLSAVAVVAQTLFSGEILAKWLYMEYHRRENERIFDDMHKLFLNFTADKKNEFKAQIIDNFVKYESVKAHCGIKLSSKVFHEINTETSRQWEEIKDHLKVDNVTINR